MMTCGVIVVPYQQFLLSNVVIPGEELWYFGNLLQLWLVKGDICVVDMLGVVFVLLCCEVCKGNAVFTWK